ncbi:uncharacterized protein LOC124911959 [Impatiens glandulifera]|uniref:uncharacterized protein LOC124911959 n=1 Tax=Impatiens glandulifera TaxID=253017 RepID=UPI001FB06120|nr:uncharacterized protein LOC124911959 [Impatiens glandulifera]
MILQIVLVCIVSYIYFALRPPHAKRVSASSINSPRVKLRDGRHLSYKEQGVPKEQAMYKIILVHGFGGSKDFTIPVSREIIDNMGIYFLSFDRAGYGESDPYPRRSVKSEAFDIEELADKLELGSKFYVMGISMGGYIVWSCLKHIPHRLAGAALVVPFVNYWWRSLPADLAKETFEMLLVQDQWTFRIAHYAPFMFNWWMSQKWFPSLSLLEEGNISSLSPSDIEILKNLPTTPPQVKERIRQQGNYESLYRDILTGFGEWGFDFMDVNDPFSKGDGSVHIWQGREDRIIPYQINGYISEKLPWIRYHEIPDIGHLLFSNATLCEDILRELLLFP